MIIKKKDDCVSRGGDNLSDWDYRIVTKIMSERGKVKGVRDIDQANLIRQYIGGIYRGFIDNCSKE